MDLAMSRTCSQDATVFALQPPLKIKACAQHTALLVEKHTSVFTIAAFDFIEEPEDYVEYVERSSGSATTLSLFCKKGAKAIDIKPAVASRQSRKPCKLWWIGALMNCRQRWNNATRRSKKN